MQRRTLAAPIILACAFAATGAQAQSIDYGSLEQLFGEPVTTSATGLPQKATEVPANLEIITADDIRRSGAHDIPGVLRHVAGVDVAQRTADDEDVSVNGYNTAMSPRLLVLINGRQVYADFDGYTPWSAVPVELAEIRQIEVVKGPNSALFGFNAVGGVINIVTYNPLYDDVKTATLAGGTQGQAEGSAVVSTKLTDRVGVLIAAGGRSNNDFSTPLLPAEEGVRRGDNRGEINVTANFQVNDKIQVSVEGTHSEANDDEDQIVFTPNYFRYDTNSVKGQVTADTPVGLLQGTVYSNFLHVNLFTAATTTPQADISNQITVLQFQDLYKVDDDNTLRGSFEYRHNTVSTTTDAGEHVFYDVLSGSATETWRILPTLTLTNAFRLDSLMLGRDGFQQPGVLFPNSSYNRTITTPSYNSGLIWQPDDVDTFRVTAARGVQLPNLGEFGDSTQTVGPLFVGGTPNVQPTVVTHYEIGFDRQIDAIGGLVRLSAFHEETDNVASFIGTFTISPTSIQLLSANIFNSRADGAELEVKGKIGPDWRYGFSYTPEFITDGPLFKNVDQALTGIDFQHTTPANIVKANVGFTSGNWEGDLFGEYDSSTHGLAPVQTPIPQLSTALVPIKSFISFDARLAYKPIDWVTIALDAEDFTQATQQQTTNANVERRVFGSVTFNF